jgi:hypothetical protein
VRAEKLNKSTAMTGEFNINISLTMQNLRLLWAIYTTEKLVLADARGSYRKSW